MLSALLHDEMEASARVTAEVAVHRHRQIRSRVMAGYGWHSSLKRFKNRDASTSAVAFDAAQYILGRRSAQVAFFFPIFYETFLLLLMMRSHGDVIQHLDASVKTKVCVQLHI